MFDWEEFSDKQLDVIFPEEGWGFLNVLEGSVRSGKTTCSLVAWMHYLGNAPVGKMAMIGKTLRTLKHNILDPLLDMYGPDLVQANYGKGEAILAGRVVYLFGSNDIRAEYNIRGGTWAGVYCDEVTLFDEAFFMMLLSRVSVKGARIFITTNPDSPYHWFHKKILEREAEFNEQSLNHLKRWRFRIDDNLSLDPEYVARLKTQYVGLWYERYINGLWTLAEGAIYGGLFDDSHLIDEANLPFITQYYIGSDYGTTDSPTVFVLLGLGMDKCLYVLDEWGYSGTKSGRPKTDLELTQDFYAFAGHRMIKRAWVDPTAVSFITQLSRFGDVPIRKGYNRDVRYGIRAVSALLGVDKLKFVRGKTDHTLGEMSAYSWDSKAAATTGKEKPIKKDDHYVDALRYVVVGMRQLWKGWLGFIEEIDEAA